MATTIGKMSGELLWKFKQNETKQKQIEDEFCPRSEKQGGFLGGDGIRRDGSLKE